MVSVHSKSLASSRSGIYSCCLLLNNYWFINTLSEPNYKVWFNHFVYNIIFNNVLKKRCTLFWIKYLLNCSTIFWHALKMLWMITITNLYGFIRWKSNVTERKISQLICVTFLILSRNTERLGQTSLLFWY